MDLNPDFLTLIRLGIKFIAHRYQQCRLATHEYQVVKTLYGPVKGRRRRNIYEEFGLYYAFEGIPYAKKPLGALRFRAPQPPEPWNEILDCTNFKPKPMQYDYILKCAVGCEDCLYLNVYTKTLKTDKPLPVMVWIYGGGFNIGEASRDLYSPDQLMQNDVVLVTFNYRLGVFGFMCLDDPEIQIPGNAGLKDQVLALKWVKENIHNFNGDPNNITLFGESAGAASVHLMMLTPRANGLFHKAIMQSGTALCPFAFTKQHDYSYKLAKHIGYTGKNVDGDVYRFLMAQSSKTLTFKDLDIMTKEDFMSNIIVFFRPVIEPFIMPDCIADKPFKDMLSIGWGNKIPVIIGANSSEGLLYYSTAQKYTFLIDDITDLVNFLPDDLNSSYEKQQLKEMGSVLKHTYFDGDQPNIKKHFGKYLDLMGHRMFWHGVFRVMRARLTYAPVSPTYCYRFDFDSPFLNQFRILKCGKSVRGVGHADDLPYLFNNVMSPKLSKSCPEFKCVNRMVTMWYNFALTSNPNCKEEESSKVVWKPIVNSSEPFKCLNISDKLEFKDLPDYEKLLVWDGVYKRDDLI